MKESPIGSTFNKLTVKSVGKKIIGKFNRTIWICSCVCGNVKEVLPSAVKLGKIKSCGCGKYDGIGVVRRIHSHTIKGKQHSRTYRSWSAMIQRCTNSKKDTFSHYGGRGIKVCDRWFTFKNFLDDMGERPDKTTLDRIDVNGNYEPANCRWATKHEQGSNCRNSKFLTCNGETMTLAQWGRKTGIDKRTIWSRINKQGWSIEKAINTPIEKVINS